MRIAPNDLNVSHPDGLKHLFSASLREVRVNSVTNLCSY